MAKRPRDYLKDIKETEKKLGTILGQNIDRLRKVAADYAKEEYGRMLLKYVKDKSKESTTRKTKSDIDFAFTLAVRAYAFDRSRRMTLARKDFKAFFVQMFSRSVSFMQDRVLVNIKKSFDIQGRIKGDIEGSGKWKPHSKSYREYRRRKKISPIGKLGHFSGEMLRGLASMQFGGKDIIFDMREKSEGAREFTVDFARSSGGKKLARFYFGRTKGASYQPPRKFTFLKKSDINEIEKWMGKSFDTKVFSFYQFFAGVHVGKVPTKPTMPIFRRMPIEPTRWI